MSSKVISIVLSLVIAAIIGAVLFFGMNRDDLYPGDRLEERPCRECGGSGKEPPAGEGMASEGVPPEQMPPGYPRPGGPCIGCGGRGKVKVNVPGPDHPTVIKIVVYDGAVDAALGRDNADLHGMDEAERQAVARALAERNPMQPVPGAVADATIAFEGGGKSLTVHSNSTGRARALLPPAVYKVTTRAAGFTDYTTALTVSPLTFPIWLEKARIIREPESQGQEQTEHGLEMRIPLVKK